MDEKTPERPPERPWDAAQRDGRRRRGRRGRGGRPPVPGVPGQPFRPPTEEDEGSAQAREVGAYERRQQRGGPRPPFRPGGWRPPVPGGRPPMPGGPRVQRYQDMVRRATAGPSNVAPQEAGEPIAGPHAVLEALRAGRVIRRIYIAQERGTRTGAMNDVVREAQERRVQMRFVDRLEIQRLSPGVDHQGVVAIAEGRAGLDLDEMILHLETLTEPPLVLIVDSLQDPQNFGVLLRSAEGAGVNGVVMPRHRQVGLTPAVARTSAGATEHLLIADVVNLRQAIDAIKEKGIWVVGTDESGELGWDEVDYRGATAIVIGGEGEGIRRLVLEACDQVVRIPMQGKIASLNAAAAGTIVLYEALRQRMRNAPPATGGIPPRRQPADTETDSGPATEENEAVPEASAPEPVTDETPVNTEDSSADQLLDADAPVGDEIRGDDQDVEGVAEAETTADPETEDAAPAPAARRAAKRTAAKATKPVAKRAPRKPTAD